jgi:hypothetical protein
VLQQFKNNYVNRNLACYGKQEMAAERLLSMHRSVQNSTLAVVLQNPRQGGGSVWLGALFH